MMDYMVPVILIILSIALIALAIRNFKRLKDREHQEMMERAQQGVQKEKAFKQKLAGQILPLADQYLSRFHQEWSEFVTAHPGLQLIYLKGSEWESCSVDSFGSYQGLCKAVGTIRSNCLFSESAIFFHEWNQKVTLDWEKVSYDNWDSYYKAFQEIEEEMKRGKPLVSVTTIPKADILYYAAKGSVQYTTSVSGGETTATGGGVNAGNAFVGGVLFGDAGAVIGSRLGTEVRVKTDPIQTHTHRHDERVVELYYRTGGTTTVKTFDYFWRKAFLQIMPEKDYELMQAKAVKQSLTEQDEEEHRIQQIKQYKELMDSGVLTPEEFEAKKKQILGL